MNYRDLAYLQEAYYNGVHQLDELSSRVEHNASNKASNLAYKAGEYDRNTRSANSGLAAAAAAARATRIRNAVTRSTQRRLARQAAQQQAESYDFYDVVLDHLLDEGYADTYESAEAIMVNMSEDWVDAIIDEELEQLDEISLKTQMGAYAATQDPDADYAYGSKVHAQGERIRAAIVKKHGPKAGEHADAHADSTHWGRTDRRTGKPQDRPAPRGSRPAQPRVTKSGKMHKTDQNALKNRLIRQRNARDY